MCDTNNFPKDDIINIHIEDDGTITITTAGISGEVHKTAEEFLKMMTAELGARVETHQHKPQHHNHVSTKSRSTVKIGR